MCSSSIDFTSLTAVLAPAVLHPQYKLDYFKELKWPQAWQETAREVVEAEYRNNYAGRFNPPTAPQQPAKKRRGSPASEQDADRGVDARALDTDSSDSDEVST